MTFSRYETPPIVPNIVATENGDYAILQWQHSLDAQLVASLERGEVLGNFCITGFNDTPYGAFAWLVAAVGTVDEFADPNADLFWFDFIFNPEDFSGYMRRWFSALKKQSSLSLGIPFLDRSIRLNALLHNKQLQQLIDTLEKSIEVWTPRTDYRKAVEWLCKNVIDKAIAEGQELIPLKYGQQDPLQVLLDCLSQSAYANLPSEHPFHQMFATATDAEAVVEYLNQWQASFPLELLNKQSDSVEENLKRDWLFAKICIESNPTKPRIAVGSVNGMWVWADMPYGGRPEVIYLMSKTYRFLLGRNWKNILRRTDVLISAIEIPAIAALGKVPKRKVFESVDRILQGAALDRAFEIVQTTAIIIGKKGLEEIVFSPLSKGGLKCYFKVTLSHDSTRATDLVIVGTIDAPAGKIEAVGVVQSSELQLILFLVAIAYRDLLVAREQTVAPYNRKHSGKKSPSKAKSEQLKLVARIKQTKAEIGKNFADPDKLIKALRKFSSYLRSCHTRRLQEGWHASERALAIAAEYDWIVPEGYTFVKTTEVVGTEDKQRMRAEFRSISLMNVLFD